MTVSWPVGQIAEIDWAGPLGNLTGTRWRDNAIRNNAGNWDRLENGFTVLAKQVTAVRPLKLVPQEAAESPAGPVPALSELDLDALVVLGVLAERLAEVRAERDRLRAGLDAMRRALTRWNRRGFQWVFDVADEAMRRKP